MVSVWCRNVLLFYLFISFSWWYYVSSSINRTEGLVLDIVHNTAKYEFHFGFFYTNRSFFDALSIQASNIMVGIMCTLCQLNWIEVTKTATNKRTDTEKNACCWTIVIVIGTLIYSVVFVSQSSGHANWMKASELLLFINNNRYTTHNIFPSLALTVSLFLFAQQVSWHFHLLVEFPSIFSLQWKTSLFHFCFWQFWKSLWL